MMKRSIALVISICLILSIRVMAEEGITIKMDETAMVFTEATGRPFIDENNRTQVPVRLALESFGAEVGWNGEDSIVEVSYEGDLLEIPIGKKEIIMNGGSIAIDTAALIKEGRTYLPIRSVIEALGGSVTWDASARAVVISQEMLEVIDVNLGSYALGLTEEEIIEAYGEADLKVPSVYGFDWWIYRNDYKGYLQLGVYDGYLEAILITEADDLWPYDLEVGMTLDQAESFGVTKSQSGWFYADRLKFSDSCTSVVEGQVTLWPFIDDYDNERIHTLIAVRTDYEDRWLASDDCSEVTTTSVEQEIFELTNAFRVSKGLDPLDLDPLLSQVARDHSEDMNAEGYFSHTNKEGESPFDRMSNYGITYAMASENIAVGQTSAINVVDAWINSDGHRMNILSEYELVGIGVSEGLYYTQDFILER